MSPTTRHSADHEPLLLGLLSGEIDDPQGERRRELADCPVCKLELDELPRFAADLDRLGREHREDVATASAAGPEEEALMLRAWREHLARDTPTRTRFPSRRLLAGLAAAACIAVVIWIARERRVDPEPPVGPTPLGEEVRVITPRGGGADFSVFQWEHESTPGLTYHVEVWADEERMTPVAKSTGRLRTPEWKPEPASIEAWPDRILWSVTVLDVGGKPIRFSQPVWAWR